MADIRITSGLSNVPAARPAADRSEAVRAAQRAFFEAALNSNGATTAPAKAAAVTAPRPVTTAPAALSRSPAVATTKLAAQPDEPPQRLLRPGSLLDIKV